MSEHKNGKTPPCTDAVIASGISRVVVTMADPFEKVSGAGLQQLRGAGVTVEVGLLEQDARHALGSVHDARLIDEIHAFVASRIIGDATARSAVVGLGHARIADASQFEVVEVLRSGDDCLIRARRRIGSDVRQALA